MYSQGWDHSYVAAPPQGGAFTPAAAAYGYAPPGFYGQMPQYGYMQGYNPYVYAQHYDRQQGYGRGGGRGRGGRGRGRSAPAGGRVECPLCQKWLSGQAQLEEHIRGKEHQNNMKRKEVFVCKPCNAECSGEKAYLQHCAGKAHRAKAGKGGPAELLPNKAGMIPQLSHAALQQLAQQDKPAAERIEISLSNEKAARDALSKSASMGELAESVAAAPTQPPPAATILPPRSQPSSFFVPSQVAVGNLRPGKQVYVNPQRRKADEERSRAAAETAALVEQELQAAAAEEAAANFTATELQRQGGTATATEQQPRRGPGSTWSTRRPRPPPELSPLGGPLKEVREALPAHGFREQLIEAVRSKQVVVIEGETGCGKTTQVPQYVLEDAAARKEPCMIVCTQPRRISAMGVAERVANERGEPLGGTVGYSIRMENKTSSATQLLFCTTGILLRRLEDDPELEGVTHLFIDEVHERAIEGDFLLMCLRDLLHRRQKLRIVLMSATLNAALFASYFPGGNKNNVFSIPGRTFPVTPLFLEDALEITQHVVRPNADCVRKAPKRGAPTGAGAGGSASGEPSSGDVQSKDDMDLSPEDLRKRYGSYSANVQRALQMLDHNAIDYDLIVKILQWVQLSGGPARAAEWAKERTGAAAGGSRRKKTPPSSAAAPGSGPADAGGMADAILVFMPGFKEIQTLQEMLMGTREFGSPTDREWVLPLHSGVPPEDQRLVFRRAPEGVTKVIIATNICETSVTIDDIGFVVDTGRMKENAFDPARRMATLEDVAVSRANARQRRGRAGRVREGVAVHLFTRHRHDHILNGHQAPEVQRVPLEQLVLRIKALGFPGTAASVCEKLLEPPSPDAVDRAVKELVNLEALTVSADAKTETLTALGRHLSTLPVDVRIGKLILLGAIFGVTDHAVTDAALTIAATISYRSPFLSPFDRRDEADKSKADFRRGQSDLLAMLQAYAEWDDIQGAAKFQFCRDRFLSIKSLQIISGLKRQLLELLSDAGFVVQGLRARSVETLGRRTNDSDGVRLALAGKGAGGGGGGGCHRCGGPHMARDCEASEEEVAERRQRLAADTEALLAPIDVQAAAPLLKALLCAALYPQILTVEATKPKSGKPLKPEHLKFRLRENGEQVEVALHPSSVNAKEVSFASQYLVFHERLKTTRVYVRDVTPVPKLALLLFGGTLEKEEVAAPPYQIQQQRGRGGRGTWHRQQQQSGEAILTVDGWLRFALERRVVDVILNVRKQLDFVLKRKIEAPDLELSEATREIMAVIKMLVEDAR
mmetsp:Transcript_31138/g.101469  ORF Transcript_31138/g.101469 Transcript_31138/m.101469 type:complete len:1282 (-) Transcript_31138:80-3925(-)